MAHNLMTTAGGRVAMVSVGPNPWHGLGQRMPGDGMTIAQAVVQAGLDWPVRTEPLFLRDGRQMHRVAILRDVPGAVSVELGNAAPGYTVVQNTEAFGILQDAADTHGLTVKTAGALGNGERVWMLAALPTGQITVPALGGDDPVHGYLLIVAAHDGSGAVSGRFTPIRVVCQNTLTAATSGTSRAMIAIRHTKSATARVKEAGRLVEQAIAAARQTGETFAQLAQRRMTEADLRAYLARVFPPPSGTTEATLPDYLRIRRQVVATLVAEGKGAELSGRTAWGAVNAVAEYMDHVKPREAKSAGAVRSAQTSALFGAGDATKIKALTAARALVAA